MSAWIPVSQNKAQRASLNGIYGGALHKVYPRGVFYASNTSGAPGQPPANRVFPQGQNQVSDPRATSTSYFTVNSKSDLSGLIAGGAMTNNYIGGSVGAPSSVTPSTSNNYIFYGALALLGYVIFFK